MNTFTKIIRPELLGKTPFGDNMVFAVKANTGCGYPPSASTPSLRDWASKDRDVFSPVVRRLVDSGHQIAAITNMHELAFGITSEHRRFEDIDNPISETLRFEDVDNPRKTGYIPGGSSGGSAAAVAMNAVSFALGTDTGGSMRIPASLCGVVGYHPTIGLYSTFAVCPISSTTDTIGIFAHKVTTVQQAHKAIEPSYSPEVRSLSGVRVGVPRKYFYSVLDSDVSQITEAALQTLRAAGVELVECDINFPSSFSVMISSFLDLIVYEIGHLLPKFLKDHDAPVSFEELCKQIADKTVKEIISTAHKIPEERYRECQQDAVEIGKLLEDYFTTNRLEAFVVPTTILPALKRPSPDSVKVCGQEFPTLHAYVHNSIHQASAGVPCISIPSGLSPDGLPIGLELVAPRGTDSNLLNLAAAVQAVLPTMPQLSFDGFKDKYM